MKITDTFLNIMSSFDNDKFNFNKWKKYIDSALPGVSLMFIEDAKRCLETNKVSWEKDYLPVLNAVAKNEPLRNKAHNSFAAATKNLSNTIYDKFGKSLDVDIVFYLGLCNGAGWASEYNGQKTVFLGIEKIMELNLCSKEDMCGLIYHELGHIYHGQYGVLDRTFDSSSDTFLWQLFQEGIAMYFEQRLVGDFDYYHQDKNGWKDWCDAHFDEIKADFSRDLNGMTFSNQRYFGDWVSYNGHGDTGYYLGCRFVHFILSKYKFDEIICFDIDNVRRLFDEFI